MNKQVVNHFKTYLKIVKNSTGSKLFRNLYITQNNKDYDILRNGDLSCAFFVSSILKLFDLIDRPHGTVDNTVKQLEKNWMKVKKNPQAGDIIVWESKKFSNNDEHKHIGFYIGLNKAISNSFKKRMPVKHNIEFRDRRIIAIFRFKDWDKIGKGTS